MNDLTGQMADAYEWDGDWSAIVSVTERDRLGEELQRELCSAHLLYGQEAVALARRWRRDDVLFGLTDGRFAQVHLTWRQQSNPEWPATQIYESFEDWKSVPPEDR
ncbi:MAG: hypothetical protein J0H20_15830 [Rhizobiales bacterium]|nr:hypothetical protein [Hyphomicrobiales bacterium]